MRKLLVLALFASVAAASQAIIFPVGPFPPAFTENFDAMAPNGYVSFPVFSLNGAASGMTSLGLLNVGTPAPFLSGPNGMFGKGVDVQIRMTSPRRFFGGWFRNTLIGIVPATTVKFKFYNAANVLIGQSTVPLTATWTWHGYLTLPKWQRAEIIGNSPIPGFVSMDNLRVRP